MDITTAAPREIDEKLADLYRAEMQAENSLTAVVASFHGYLGERATYVSRTRKTWPTTDAQAVEAIRVKAEAGESMSSMYSYRPFATAWVKYEEAVNALAAVRADAKPLNEEYSRRPWSRFFLVTSSDGHIHRDMACSTCRISTEYGWLPQLSGKTEADAVADQGTRLCSVCFPTAPVEWTLGVTKPSNHCDGGYAEPGTRKRVGMNIYGDCPTCATRQIVTGTGVVRKHKPATK